MTTIEAKLARWKAAYDELRDVQTRLTHAVAADPDSEQVRALQAAVKELSQKSEVLLFEAQKALRAARSQQ